jgi:hypothetical protein
MRSKLGLIFGMLGLVAVGVVGTGAAFAARETAPTLSAAMAPGQVVPSKPKGNVQGAKGSFTATLTNTGTNSKLAWRITYKKLDNPALVIADIHYGKPGRFGPIIVRLCGPCKSGQKGVAKVKGAWVPAIRSGSAFITLITGENPNGEIRGQIKVG